MRVTLGTSLAAACIIRLLKRLATRAQAEVRLTLLAIWRGACGVYSSDDLTFASSIAYYALLSLFPFFLLALSVLAGVTATDADRAAVLGFVLRNFPQQFVFVNEQLTSWQQSRVQLGVAGSILTVWAATSFSAYRAGRRDRLANSRIWSLL